MVLTLLAKVDCGAASQTYNVSAQAYYFDPTRNVNPVQRISPLPFAFAVTSSLSVSTSYESGGAVSGTNYNGLSSTLENVIVNTDNRIPTLSSSLNLPVIQSGALVSYTPTSSFVPNNGGVLSFSWSRAAVSGISATPSAGTGSISETLFNVTSSAINVGYTYSLLVNGCTKASATVTALVAGSVPVITSFVPARGPISTSVTITGRNFNPTANKNVVFFGATQAVVSGASSTSLTVTVPYGANYQYISVTNLAYNTIGYSAAPFVVTYSPTGDNSFLPKKSLSAGTAPTSAAILDLNLDGKPDLVVANANNTVSIFPNTTSVAGATSTNFGSAITLTGALGSVSSSVAVADVDGDGWPDVALVNSNLGLVSIFRSTSSSSTISFTTQALTFTTGTSPSSVVMVVWIWRLLTALQRMYLYFEINPYHAQLLLLCHKP